MNLKHLLPVPLLALAALFSAPVAGHAQVLLTASEFALLGGTAITVGGARHQHQDRRATPPASHGQAQHP